MVGLYQAFMRKTLKYRQVIWVLVSLHNGISPLYKINNYKNRVDIDLYSNQCQFRLILGGKNCSYENCIKFNFTDIVLESMSPGVYKIYFW